jgi:hypothetical protein
MDGCFGRNGDQLPPWMKQNAAKWTSSRQSDSASFMFMVAKGWTEKGKNSNNMLGSMNFRVCIFFYD